MKMSFSLALFVIVFAPGCSPSHAPAFDSASKNYEVSTLHILRNGSCASKKGKEVPLDNIKFLVEKIRPLRNVGEFSKIEISKAKLVFFSTLPDGEISASSYVNVRQFLINEYNYNEPFDIQLSFAQLNSTEVLYWREPYENIPSKQGLIEMHGNSLTPICSGVQGSYDSH